MHSLATRPARYPANGRASTSRSIPCLLKIPASPPPIQLNTKTLFCGMTTLTFSKLCAAAVVPTRADIRAARQTKTDLLFMPAPGCCEPRSCGDNKPAPATVSDAAICRQWQHGVWCSYLAVEQRLTLSLLLRAVTDGGSSAGAPPLRQTSIQRSRSTLSSRLAGGIAEANLFSGRPSSKPSDPWGVLHALLLHAS